MAQLALLGIGRRLGQRPVDFSDAPLAEHLVEARQRLRGLGEEYRPAHGTVDAVHHAEEDLAGFGVAPLDEGLDLVLEGALTRRVGLHQVAAVFIDNQQVIVLVENVVG